MGRGDRDNRENRDEWEIPIKRSDPINPIKRSDPINPIIIKEVKRSGSALMPPPKTP